MPDYPGGCYNGPCDRSHKIVNLPLCLANVIKNGEFFFDENYDMRIEVVPVSSTYRTRLERALPAIVAAALKYYYDVMNAGECPSEQQNST